MIKKNNQTIDKIYKGSVEIAKIYKGSTLVYENYRDMVVSGNDVINITKAKANSLNYLKAFGKCEQNGTPTPDSPVDIMCNNGTLKYGLLGKNLFDISAYDDASVWTGTSYKYIAIPLPNGTYTISWDKSKGGGFYWLVQVDGTKKGTSSATPGGSWLWHDTNTSLQKETFTFTVTEGYVYFTCSFGGYFVQKFLPALQTVQIEKGETATAFESYKGRGIYADGTQETINVHGKNLFDKNSAVNNRTFAWTSGEPITEQNSWISDFIPIVHNTSYVSNYYLSQIFIYDENKTAILVLRNNTWEKLSSVGGGVVNVFTTPNEGSYLRFSLRRDPSTGTPAASPDLVQLELGSTATAYEPYFNGGTATCKNLLSVGTYEDEQDIISGAVTRNVGIMVLTGNEDWVLSTSKPKRFYLVLPSNTYKQENFTPICTHFKGHAGTTSTSSLSSNEFSFYYNYPSGNTIQELYVYANIEVSTANDFKQWLNQQYTNGTPVIIVYPLATSTTETATAQPVNIQKGANTIQVTQASINDLELEIKYKGK